MRECTFAYNDLPTMRSSVKYWAGVMEKQNGPTRMAVNIEKYYGVQAQADNLSRFAGVGAPNKVSI